MYINSRLIIVLLSLTLSTAITFANVADTTRRITVRLGVYQVISEEVSYNYSSSGNETETPLPIAVANIKIGCEVAKNFEIGGYVAYSNMGHRVPLVKNSDGMYVLIDSEGVIRISSNTNNFLLSSNTLFYGLTAKYNLLPVLTGKDNLRFSLNATSKAGFVSAKWEELEGVDWIKNWNDPFTEFGVGLGAGYSITKRLGVNLSYSVGKFYNNANSRLYLGVGFKF
jgi:hypothetical protein